MLFIFIKQVVDPERGCSPNCPLLLSVSSGGLSGAEER